ncbi:hypothetical protein PG996_010744 [Apiospora saccharicola]|uniref:Uncharacterized protein n=1 Tax=Apiospora saccharicola TaxID=335842 RepID=A0ABR1USJ3_9PEZI
MDSNRQLSQPARTSSSDPAHPQWNPQWNYEEEVKAIFERNRTRESSSENSDPLPLIDMSKDGADLCVLKWLDLDLDHVCHLSPYARQLIESVDELEEAVRKVSYMSRRPHCYPSSSSSRPSTSTSSPSSSAGAPSLQDAVEAQTRALHLLQGLVRREVNEEVEKGLLEKSRRELAKEKLKEDEDRGIQIQRMGMGLPTNSTDNDGNSTVPPRSQSAIVVQSELAKGLSRAYWRQTW